ncbi:NAD-dependent epimerase/dehydratase family protein [Archangium sp.]|uniref:NAD-dependent epimerase/dehydratase family protein n=1 Tax=Archangium sp. TaxID=1872627 RepID=UPI00389A8CC2
MRIFVAGATGAMGVPLVKRLVAAGHQVTGLTRSESKRPLLESLGATVAVADVFEAGRLGTVLREARPEVVVHLLTALPKTGPMRAADLEGTNRLRTEGTKNLVEAASSAGARRLVAESIVLVYGYDNSGSAPLTEEHPLARTAPRPWLQSTVDAGLVLEETVLSAARAGRLEGLVLRYGFIYGAGAGSTDGMVDRVKKRRMPLLGDGSGVWSWIHIDDAASATLAAIERGRSGEIYNVVDDEPVTWRDYLTHFAQVLGAPRPFQAPLWLVRLVSPYAALSLSNLLPVSNAKARRELGWRPEYPTYREGLATLASGARARKG